jgi:hypothetical protein
MYGMTGRLLRAPASDGGLLVDPPPEGAARLLASNAADLGAWEHDFQGRRASWLRAHIRREVIAEAHRFLTSHGLDSPATGADISSQASGPLVVTGHQPELFHPGVWIKNFAAAAIAGVTGGLALNLIVDNDLPKASSIRVPRLESGETRARRIDFDRWGGDIPFEDLSVRDESMLATFGARAREFMGEAVRDPLLDDFWPRVIERRGETPNLGLRFALARRALEASWGVWNLEVPLGTIGRCEGFLWFVSHLLAQLPRYRQIHNGALADYRAAHHIRSKNHPVAALAQEGEWLEAPFWVWRAEAPRRRGLLVRQRSNVMDLRIAGESEVLIELPLAPEREACCAVERLRELDARSVRLRSRALTTTMFSRFLLGDLFIHGIGGAKYDELGDVISRRFFGMEPPGFLTVSMTLWLGLPGGTVEPGELAAIDRQLRGLKYNPDLYLSEPYPEPVRNLIRIKREALAGSVKSSRDRKARFRAIRRCDEALQPWVQPLRDALLESKARTLRDQRSAELARNREFAFVLHSGESLKHKMAGAAFSAWPRERGGTNQPETTA